MGMSGLKDSNIVLQRQHLRGFTIVELLIVVVVIAILAAIAVVSYNGIQAKAHDATVRSDLHHVANLMNLYSIDNGEIFPFDPAGDPGTLCDQASTTIRSGLTSIKMKLSVGSYDSTPNANLLYIASNDGKQFALLAFAKNNPTYYVSDKTGSAKEYIPSGSIPQSRFPGGTPCGVADNLGISSLSTHTDFGFYYIFVKGAGGFRIWI